MWGVLLEETAVTGLLVYKLFSSRGSSAVMRRFSSVFGLGFLPDGWRHGLLACH